MDRRKSVFRAQGSPDIMNDPAYAPSRGENGKGVDEPDTCRICRGEGTEGDELFFPCKCSGSIKFVHQGCLTEWLSHSQKKYCELCKTPFRFTKLYDPNMPQELPVPVFLKELVLHGCRSLFTWLRFMLVAFVWLGWLPWSMRALWRGLFWLADGRWPGSPDSYQKNGVSTANVTMPDLVALGTSRATSTLASNSPAGPTTAASIATAIPYILAPVSSMLNFSDGEPLLYSVVKSFIMNTFVTSTTSTDATATSPANANVTVVRRLREPSWLSDISFLNRLTPYPTLNNILIDTLEGQLITLLVVISFILVFLIREWVVQQQPILNFAEGEREAAAQLMAEELRNRRDDPGQDDGQRHDAEDTETQEERGLESEIQADESPDANDAIASLPSTEFHVPDPISARPQFPTVEQDRDFTQASEHVRGDTEPGPSTNNEDVDVSPPQTVTDSIRRQKQPASDAYANTPSDSFWNLSGNLPESEHADHDDILGSATSSVPGTNRESQGNRKASLNGNEARGNSEVVGPPQSGFDISLPISQPKSPIFRGNVRDEIAGSSQRPSSLFFEPPSPGPSKIDATSDKHSDSHSDNNLGTPERPVESTETTEIQAPLTPTSLDNASDPAIDDLQTPVETSEETHENAEDQGAANDQRVLSERVANWLWGDIPIPDPQQQDEADNDEEHVVEDPAQEAPFVPVRHHDGNIDVAQDEPDLGAAPAAAAAAADGNDADAVDDADDLEGIMELIGMQGPIFGLLQNGVFSALLIAFTVAVGIWIPYMCGKVGLVLLTNPIRFLIRVPLTMVSVVAGIAADTFIGSIAYIVYLGNLVLRILMKQLGTLIPPLQKLSESNAVTSATMSLMEGSGQRLKRMTIFVLTFHETGRPTFSMLSHQALKIHQTRLAAVCSFILRISRGIVYDLPVLILTTKDPISLFQRVVLSVPAELQQVATAIASGIKDFLSATVRTLNVSYLTTVSNDYGSFSLDPELARWDTKDRVVAIIVGYCLATFAGLVYLRVSTVFSGVYHQQRVNGAVADALRQAGGVMKVVLIIGIEMIVFPLYCGILLDIALLPLFETATVMSRLSFTKESPLTSLFVHWFVGTCYMFHFALFVSMCRKILRRGVLCKSTFWFPSYYFHDSNC